MTAPPILYTTPEQARADAARLGEAGVIGEATHSAVVDLVANPCANSDALLIMADRLRRACDDALFREDNAARADLLLVWANTLTDLAPTRANPIEDAACRRA